MLDYQDKHQQIRFTPRLSDLYHYQICYFVPRFRLQKRDTHLVRVDADFMNEYYDTPETGSQLPNQNTMQTGIKGQ